MFFRLRCTWIVVNHLRKQSCFCAPVFKNAHLLSYQIFNYNFHTSISNESENKDILIMKKWIEMCRFEGECVPEKITDKELQTLIELKGFFQRKKFLKFLFKKEIAKQEQKLREEKAKEKKSLLRKERELFNTGHIEYGLWKHSMFGKTTRQCIINFYNHLLVSAMIHGQPLVVDLSFDNHLEGREISSVCDQMFHLICQNRKNQNPFNVMFCNINLKSKVLQNFETRIPEFLNPEYPLTFTSECYLDLFPKEKLVYLTPDSNYEMTEFDHEAVYIIGGIADLRSQKPFTLAKAKRENIKMYKLPLDRYLKLSNKPKPLPFCVVFRILQDLKNTGDWNKALKNVPRRLILRESLYGKS